MRRWGIAVFAVVATAAGAWAVWPRHDTATAAERGTISCLRLDRATGRADIHVVVTNALPDRGRFRIHSIVHIGGSPGLVGARAEAQSAERALDPGASFAWSASPRVVSATGMLVPPSRMRHAEVVSCEVWYDDPTQQSD